ncbi:hypothetical protein [Streptomyces sp900116325]|uniref:hypothetical protein n=1 Tax=Streptomyces sp. 900116325 TaxID=3154295 RepID=UPI00331AD4E6
MGEVVAETTIAEEAVAEAVDLIPGQKRHTEAASRCAGNGGLSGPRGPAYGDHQWPFPPQHPPILPDLDRAVYEPIMTSRAALSDRTRP